MKPAQDRRDVPVTQDRRPVPGPCVHNLKVWSEYFDDVLSGRKPFEVRLNDRDYHEGDLLVLWEWNRRRGRATGSRFVAKVGYVLSGFRGLRTGWVVFALGRAVFNDLAIAAEFAEQP